MSCNNYNRFLANYTKLHETQAQWTGVLYLPPCSCHAINGPSCAEASNISKYDFETFEHLDMSTLVNVCSFIPRTSLKRDERVLTLCSKYSLHCFRELTSHLNSNKDIVKFVKQSETFEKKFECFGLLSVA